jgi:membrane-bound lytic murein transglycosylase MltF
VPRPKWIAAEKRAMKRAFVRMPGSTTGALWLTMLALLAAGCSKQQNPAPAAEAPKNAAVQPASAPAAASQPMDEDIPLVLRTPWKGDLDEIAKRRVVRVLVPFRRPEFFYVDGHPAGYLQEAFQELQKVLNAKYKTTAANQIVVALVPTPIDQVRERMVDGWGDIAAYGISITDERKQFVDFTIPTITGVKVIVVTGPGAPELKTIDDLSGKEVWVMQRTRMKDDLEALNAKLKSQGKAPAVIRDADPLLDPGDILEMVNAGTYPIALMQDKTAGFWAQVFDNVRPRTDLAVAEDVQLGWAIQKGTPKLKEFLDDFIKTHGVGTSFGNTLLRRYLKDAKYVKNARDPAEMKKMRTVAPFFKQYAAEYDFDYLLLVAQGYQESGLDQSVKSRVGAVGIMQVMPTTAASSPVNVPNIQTEQNNIRAGVRLVHFLVNDYFNEKDVDQFNRTLFAIAAYNCGPAKVARCRKLAKDMGYNPNTWFGNVEVAVAKVVGRETTQYVANIYKYYLAYRMAAQINQRRAAKKSP